MCYSSSRFSAAAIPPENARCSEQQERRRGAVLPYSVFTWVVYREKAFVWLAVSETASLMGGLSLVMGLTSQ